MLRRHWLVYFCMLGFATLSIGLGIYNQLRYTQLQADLSDLQVMMGQVEYQRDKALYINDYQLSLIRDLRHSWETVQRQLDACRQREEGM